MSEQFPCPCQSGRDYLHCCGRYHRNELAAPTAEALMQSRYSAFVVGESAYLLASWHPSTRPARLDLEDDIRWLGLRIHHCEAGQQDDSEGWVEFEARYKQGGKAGRLRERSYFVKEEGRWFYREGVVEEHPRARPEKVGRNASCPCGSGKKYKRCCG